MDKETGIYTRQNYYSNIKKNETMSFTGKWKEMEDIK